MRKIVLYKQIQVQIQRRALHLVFQSYAETTLSL